MESAKEKDFLEFVNDRLEVTAYTTILSMTIEWLCENVHPEDIYTKAQLEAAINRITSTPINY